MLVSIFLMIQKSNLASRHRGFNTRLILSVFNILFQSGFLYSPNFCVVSFPFFLEDSFAYFDVSFEGILIEVSITSLAF